MYWVHISVYNLATLSALYKPIITPLSASTHSPALSAACPPNTLSLVFQRSCIERLETPGMQLIIYCLLFLITWLRSEVVAFDCEGNGAVTINNESNQMKSGTIHVVFPEAVTRWRVVLAFDDDVNNLETWIANSEQKASNRYVLKNKSYNGVQMPGSMLDIDFNAHFAEGTSPKVKSVRVSGQQLCNGAITISTTTEDPAIAACLTSGAVVEQNVWQQGMTANLVLRFPAATSEWIAVVTFSRSLTGLEVWDANAATTDNAIYSFTNKDYNGVVQAGNELSITFNAYFSQRAQVVAVELNGIDQCTGTVSTTVSTTTTETTIISTTSVASTTITSPSTTTSGIGCIGMNYVEEMVVWGEGMNARLNVLFSTAVSSWQVTVVFDKSVTSFEAWVVDYSTADHTVFVLTSKDHNSVQAAGSQVEVDFLVHFLSKVSVVSLSLNGQQLCTDTAVGTTTEGTTTQTTLITEGTTVGTTGTSATTEATTSAATEGSTTVSTAATTPSVTITDTTTIGSTEPPTTPSNMPYNYAEVLQKSLLFYEAQRSGVLPESNRIPWRGDSATSDGNDVGHDLTGGYYDAGDGVKFGFPLAAMTTLLSWGALDFADGYAAANQTEYMLEAIRWATDYFIKCHTGPNEFYGQVGLGDVDHAYWGRHEEMNMARPAFKISASAPGSELAAETAAALAAAAGVFATVDLAYSNQLLTHAIQLYNFANNYRGLYHNSITDATKFYKSWSGYGDELAWAAAWLYKTTRNAQYLADAESHFQNFGLNQRPSEFSWDGKQAGVHVLLYQLTGQPQYQQLVEQFCDWLHSGATKTPAGLVFLQPWGSLRHAANVALICLQAAEAGLKPETYRGFARSQIGYMLGDSGRSFVVGFGHNPPQRPHHRSSSCPDLPASCDWNNFNFDGPNPQVLHGALVGGPDVNDNYIDDRGDYVKNEVANDYNAGFQSAVAGLLSLHVRGITP